MQLRYNYRAYPNASHRAAPASAFGCARVVWNDCLRARKDGRVYVAKVGELRIRWSRPLPAAPSSLTVVKDSAGRYFASFVVETDVDHLPQTGTEVGIDLGLSTFAVLSDGTKISSPRFLRRAEKKVKRLQQSLSRKATGSRNRAKARIKVARQYAKVADRRRDWRHKTSTQIIRDNQAVYVEDLAVHALGRTRLAKSVHDAGWSAFVDMLEYKAARRGRRFGKIGRIEPTSQVCSSCRDRDGPKPLHVREWTCPECGADHDREGNAAINTLAAGRADRRNASWSVGETGARASGPRDEAGRSGRTDQGRVKSSSLDSGSDQLIRA
ncbi:transposase [Streptomyces sp. NBC_00320]|uniref:RNA-guided endonuclease InsQ/TnpB family protein n=1 Tax=Streptomyces sp. NBC_00320 TaxID=2975711 RepID=UPI00224DCE3C|nr:RNA-guided endonuclease TnpB family protein [Streptomyces sp. NBC_00320]MCX5145500.1 transposase [Streptomyces sp. NBC_00320]